MDPLSRSETEPFLSYVCDDGQRNSPKHVEFYSKIKFQILMHLVGFVIRICHDARFSECQIHVL